MNRRYNKIAWVVTCIYLPLLAIICALMQGCATTGTIPTELIDQSAQVDTSISQLQTQQAESAIAGQKISDSADNIQKIAEKINNPELTEETKKLLDSKKELLESQEKERSGSTSIQSSFGTVKTSSGKEIVKDSSTTINQQSQIKARNKAIVILSIIIFIHVLLDAAVILFKFYFHK